MILLVAGLQLAAIYFPPLVAVFQGTPLSLNNLALCVGTLPLIAIETGKWITRKRKPTHIMGRERYEQAGLN
jgi:hypothetical protein